MCGRINVTTPAQSIAEFFLALNFADTEPRYNITPAQPILAVREEPERGKRILHGFYWGLIPSWARDHKIGARLTNARCETLAEKPSFRGAYKYRRCIIPIDGFYEWKREGDKKQPYYFKRVDDQPIALAGLWEHWIGPAGDEIISATIITTAANDLMTPIHHRMPVILHAADFDLWLDPKLQDGRQVNHLLQPLSGDLLRCYPVSTFVNNSRHDGPQCIEPVDSDNHPDDEEPQQLSLF